MATNTTHYGFTKPGVNDYVDVSVLNANYDNLDNVIYNNQVRAQAALDDLAPEYDATATYSVGDYVTYNKTLYRCTIAIATAEAFDDTKWTAVKVGGELKSHDARISTLEAGVDLEKSATNSFDDGIDSYFKKVVSTIVPVQAGSGTPSPSNPRAISGFTECGVFNTGKNLYNKATATDGYRIDGSGEPYPAGSYSLSDWITVDPSTQYTRNIDIVTVEPVALYDGKKNFISRIATGNTFTTTQETKYIRTATLISNKDTCQIEQGSTATAYEPYTATTATISFGSAGTVYGGYVDLISGKLVVEWGYLEPTEVYRVNQSGTTYYWLITASIDGTNGSSGSVISSHFEPASGAVAGHVYITGNGHNLIAVPTDQTLNTKELADTWVQTNNPQFAYKLATPQEYQLTPAQLRSLVGTNNLTSSTGEVTEVEYITNKTIAWLLDLIRA